mmetsp:Transcript_39153/g.93585  ORF Transcript_39153/g.93585 Transcript_39153/m.93585 type:complete len:214 (-) Transcript_39153:80-721(-)
MKRLLCSSVNRSSSGSSPMPWESSARRQSSKPISASQAAAALDLTRYVAFASSRAASSIRLFLFPPLAVEKSSAGSSKVVPKGSCRDSSGSNSMRTMIFFLLRASSRLAAASASASKLSSSLSEPPPFCEAPSCCDFWSSSGSSSPTSSATSTSCSSSIWLTEEATDMSSPSPRLPARSSCEFWCCKRFLTLTVVCASSGRHLSKAFCSAASS